MAAKLRERNRNRKRPENEERRRISESDSDFKSKSSYAYSSRRSEEELNLGRRTEAAKLKLAKTATYGTKRIGLIILILAIVISLVKVMSLSSDPHVEILGQKTNALLSRTGITTYQEAARQYLASSIWNDNKVTVNADGLSNYMLYKFPELGSVSVSVPFVDNHLVVYLTPTQPAILLVEPTATFALDSNGRAILEGKNTAALNLPSLPVLTDQSGLNVALGKMALTNSDISFVEEVVGQLDAKSYHISQMTLPASTDQLDVSLTGEPYYIKFNLEENDARQQVGTFLATIAELKSQSITPGKYVDVRVDGRAYYQ